MGENKEQQHLQVTNAADPDQSQQAAPVPLPAEVVESMLQHASLTQRLGPCARVCKPWCSAALAATSSINLQRNLNPDQLNGLHAWLASHGGSITSLQVQQPRTGAMPRQPGGHRARQALTLPLPQLRALRQLSVAGYDIHPGQPATTTHEELHVTPLCVLTGLTRLHLVNFSLAFATDLAGLSELTGLRELQLATGQFAFPNAGTPFSITGLGAALGQLVQLQRLHLEHAGLEDGELGPHISCLVHLCELNLWWCQNITAAALAHVPLSLTRLDVIAGPLRAAGITLSPRLAQLSSLQRLRVMSTRELDPSVLANLVLLTHLDITGSPLAGGAAGVESLLALLPRLQQLQVLNADSTMRQMAPAAAAAGAYSALTACSQLRCLRISGCVLPAGVGSQLFPAARQLPHLARLWCNSSSGTQDADWWSLGDMQRLVSCCPGLQELRIGWGVGVAVGRELDALLQLTGLTALSVGGEGINSEVAAAVLAKMTGLQELHITDSPGLKDAGLLALTTLRQLRALHVEQGALTVPLQPARAPFPAALCLKSQKSPSDLWLQLLQHCEQSKDWECLRQLVQQYKAQLASAQVGVLPLDRPERFEG